MTRHFSTIDWAATALGPPDTWPRSLGTLVTIMFGSRQPMFVAWGGDRILIYNDAYAPLLGKRHPSAFGRPFFDVWPETRQPVGALMDRVFGGDPVHMDDLELTLERNGFPEQAHFTFSYTPVPGKGGAIEGLFCACTEITATVLARRELEAERRRLGELFERSPSFMALLRGPEHRFELTNPAFKKLIGSRDVIGKTVREALPEVEGQGFFDLLDKVYSTGEPFTAQAAPLMIVQRPGAEPEKLYLDFVYQPMRDGSGVNGIFVEGIDVTTARADQEAVRRSATRQTLRAELGDALRGAHDEHTLTMVAAETLGRYLDAERVGYGEIDEAGDGVVIDQVWVADGQTNAPRARRRYKVGRAILGELQAGRSVVVDDVRTHPLTTGESDHRVYDTDVLRAFVAVPLIGPDRLVRILFVISPAPRAWTENEQALVQEVGERTWSSLDRLRAESALRESETRNRQVLDGAVDYAIMASDLEGRVTRWNEGAHRILGWTERDMLGQTLHRTFTREDRAAGAVEAERRSALDRGVAIDERWHLRQDGARFWASGEMTPIKDEAGAPIGFVKVMRDQTEQRRSEQALRESRERLDIALGTGLVAFFDWDVAADLVRGDQRFASFYDFAADEAARGVAPDRILQVIHPDDQRGVRDNIATAVATSDDYTKQFRLIHRDGSVHAVLVRGRCYAREGRTPLRYTGVVADVTAAAKAEAELRDLNETLEQRVQERTAELVQAQEALRQSQKLEAVGQLTGGVAHDFNNLLTIIRSAVDFLRRRDLPEERRRRYVDAISDTVDRASKLTGQLLAFARRQPLKPEVFDVRQQVENVADLVRPLVGARIRIDLDLCPTPCFTEADVGQFETALVNLAVNARDAMDGEGRLVFTVKEVGSLPAIRGHRGAASRFIAISVADTGVGIQPSNLASIFEPFFTTKEVGKGTGLGLSQVFGFVKQSGGEVDVQSKPGQGSSFTLYLPRTEADLRVEPPVPSGSETRPHGRGICVLVVEDNEAVGQFSTELLHDLGYRTTWAGNAQQALDLLDEDELRFDLVFSDVVMPGMNGIDFAELVRDRYPGLPVVLTSGYSHVLAQEGRHGFDLVQKPYSVEILSRVLRKAMSGDSSTRTRKARP